MSNPDQAAILPERRLPLSLVFLSIGASYVIAAATQASRKYETLYYSIQAAISLIGAYGIMKRSPIAVSLVFIASNIGFMYNLVNGILVLTVVGPLSDWANYAQNVCDYLEKAPDISGSTLVLAATACTGYEPRKSLERLIVETFGQIIVRGLTAFSAWRAITATRAYLALEHKKDQ